MSIIYGKGILNETIIIPVIGDKSSSHSRSDSNYEVLLPVIFIILFVLVLFLVYAYNNLNLKQKVADYVCYFGRSRRRRRHWQYAQHYGPQYNSQSIHHSHAHQFGHVSQLQKSLPPFNGVPNQNTFEVSSHPTMANFKMSTFSGKEGPMTSRRQNVYYTYKRPDSSAVAASTANTATSQYYKILKSQEAKKANRVSNNYVVMNSDGVIYSPNYAYRLNQIYDESSGASSSSVSTSDFRLPSASQTHINRLNPLFSSGNRSSQLAIHYSHSNINRESYQAESSGELKHSMNDYQFSPIAFNINETTTSQNRHHVSAASSTSSMRKSLSRRFLASGRDSMKLKQRSSTFKTLNTTAEDISECDYDDGVDDDELMANTTTKSWRRSSSGSRLSVMRPPRRLSSKISSRFKNLSSESSLLKAIRQMTNNSSSENHDINHLVLSNYSLSNAAANRQFRYARLAKSFSFVSNKRKQLIIDPPKIAEQQEILNLNKNTNHNKFLSQPNQLNSLSDDKQDVGVQTSSTNFSITTTTSSSRDAESSGDATNTMMQTNTFGSILANLGSVPTRPSSMISRSQQHQQQGVFEINRALLRSRAFSDGNGLSNIQQQTNYNHNNNTNSSNSFIIPHSVSSSKLFYKKF